MNKISSIISLGAIDLLLIPVVIGLVQAAKNMGLSSRFAPLVGVVMGVGLEAVVSAEGSLSLAHVVVVGIIVGLSSLGLYSGVKTTKTTPSV